MGRFEHGCNVIYNIGYHLIFTPKYRKSILIGKFKLIVYTAFIEKAKQLNIKIIKCEIMPDHVHLFIKCTPSHTICNVVQKLKGYSSYMVRKHYPKYRKLYKHFWSPSYYCESVGCVAYIRRNNKEIHRRSVVEKNE